MQTDVTLQIEQEQRLANSNKELDNFVHVVSHDLREPLRGMQIYTDLLIRDYSQCLDEQGQRYLERLNRLAQRLDNYLSDLYRYGRVGSFDSKLEKVSLSSLIRDCLQFYINDSSRANVQFKCKQTLPEVYSSVFTLQHIIGNILSNAVRYASSEQIVVKVRHRIIGPKQHQLWFTDNGIGIEKSQWQNIFGLFKRLHSRDAYDAGSGVGLTLAKKSAKILGGDLWIEASTPGVGTTFTFTFFEGHFTPLA